MFLCVLCLTVRWGCTCCCGLVAYKFCLCTVNLRRLNAFAHSGWTFCLIYTCATNAFLVAYIIIIWLLRYSDLVVSLRASGTVACGTSNRNCKLHLDKSSFGQTAFALQGINMWIFLPTELKLDTDSYHFKLKQKYFLESILVTYVILWLFY